MLLGAVAELQVGSYFLEDSTEAVRIDISNAKFADGFILGNSNPYSLNV